MSSKSFNDMLVEIVKLLEEHKINAEIGYQKIGTEYWFGILVESESFRKDIQKIVDKYS